MAAGGFRPGRSDLDLLVVVTGDGLADADATAARFMSSPTNEAQSTAS